MEHVNLIHVEVAYALPDEQVVLNVEVPVGTTVGEALGLSGIGARFPEVDLEGAPVGIFSRRVEHNRVLTEGDRVEIYRALQADPKAVRRKRAAEGKGAASATAPARSASRGPPRRTP